MEIYLDNAATTRPCPAALRAMDDCARRCYGNPASWHRRGVEAAKAVERARGTLARALGSQPDEIVFTSGGTEANNLALKGVAWTLGRSRRQILVSAVEHPSVSAAAKALARWGWTVTVLPVDAKGFVAPSRVAAALTARTALVSVMHANHEIGTIEPVAEIGRLCRKRGVLFHTDACQSFCKEPLDLRRLPIDLLSVNGHKVHGPKGVGALYVRRGLRLAPLLDGGGQEGGLRSGTLNTPAIAGFAAAVEDFPAAAPAEMRRLRDRLLAGLLRGAAGLRLNGPAQGRLCGNLSVTLPATEVKPLLQRLSAAGVFASAGAACHSAQTAPSPVLRAIGLTPRQAGRTLRLSLGRYTTRAQVDAAVRIISRLIGRP
ncbi:MAG: cysteine desulfurase family protein [Elusimicrobia bacterium]|nr:cysteine desulfurase family protein [Elusimicrobiota bacterium]